MAYLNTVSVQKHSREFDIPFDRQQLADYLNVERSVLSNELSKMQRSERSFDRASKNERKTNLRKRYSLKMDKVAMPFPQLKVNLRVGRRIRELVGSWSERPL